MSPELFNEALQAITTAGTYPPNVDTIWGLRAADFSGVGPDGMRRLLAVRTQYASRAGARTAFVVASDVAYGMSRMFQMFAENTMPQDFCVQRTMEDALAWVLEGRNKA